MKLPRSLLRRAFLALAFFSFSLCSATLHAQQQILWTPLQDGAAANLYSCDPQPVLRPAEWFATYHGFQFYSDSTYIMNIISGVRQNGNNLRLTDWKYERHIDSLDAPTLSERTTTDPFTVATGDSISFFRMFRWIYPSIGYYNYNPDLFYSPDTIEFSIVMHRASNNARVAILDTLGVLRQIPSGPPVFYGNDPIVRNVHYRVPPQLNGAQVYLRYNVYQRGPGNHYPDRADDWGVNLPGFLTNSEYTNFMARFNTSFASQKRSRERAQAEALLAASGLSFAITPNPVTKGIAIIDVIRANSSAIAGQNDVRIVVFDAAGGTVATLPVTFGDTSAKLTYNFPASGAYFVALYAGEAFIRSERILVY